MFVSYKMSVDLYLDEVTLLPTALSREITLGKKLPSTGAHSKIYEAFINGKQGYLAKIIPLDGINREDCPSDELIVKNELIIAEEMGNLGVGPMVHAIALDRYKGIIVMDQYDGTLADILLSYQTKKEVPLDSIIETVRKLIIIMHDNGIVHRDLIPTNILYKNDGTFVISDYGLAIRSELIDDWKFYNALVSLIDRIKNGEKFASVRDIIKGFDVEGLEPLTFIWKGNECYDWI